MTVFCTTTADLPFDVSFCKGWDEILRWLDVFRFLIWFLRWMKELLCPRAGAAPKQHDYVMRSLSRNEFGYVDMRGAY